MKKLLALTMALLMALSCMSAFADTIYTKVLVDEEVAESLMALYGMDEDQLALVDPILSLVNAIGVNVITAEDGAPVDVDLNGANAFSLGFAANEAGATVASTLFPNYVLTVSQETMNEFMKQFAANMPGASAGGEGGMDMTALILAAAGLWALCRFGVGTVGEQTYVPVTLRREGRELKVLALRDTGNTLRDPITGEPVLVAGADVAQELLGLTEYQLVHPVETLACGTVPGLRLIPSHSVGRSGGMMLALRMKDATVGKNRGDVIVAFAQENIGQGEMYRMLTGGAV